MAVNIKKKRPKKVRPAKMKIAQVPTPKRSATNATKVFPRALVEKASARLEVGKRIVTFAASAKARPTSTERRLGDDVWPELRRLAIIAGCRVIFFPARMRSSFGSEARATIHWLYYDKVHCTQAIGDSYLVSKYLVWKLLGGEGKTKKRESPSRRKNFAYNVEPRDYARGMRHLVKRLRVEGKPLSEKAILRKYSTARIARCGACLRDLAARRKESAGG